jgi:hypothetical protein
MAELQTPPRAALYVDFDNVFMALVRWDERAAYGFGERPDAWLAWLEGRVAGGPPATRRTLIRRCYLNPGGFYDFQPGRPVARYRATRDLRNRTYYGEFRAAFVQAGFDVVDCPPVAYLKNSADMKMALDIREALDHPTRFDEFVLLSGDSDFLPALARLRAHDRRITILAQNTAKPAYLAAADEVVGLDEFAHDGMGNLPIAQFGAAPSLPAAPAARPEPPRPEPSRPSGPDLPALREQALGWLRDALARSAAGALRLTEVGQALPRAFPALRHTAYAGAGSLGALIEEARDPRLSLAGPPARRWVFDADRGPPPGDLPPGVEEAPGAEESPSVEEAPGLALQTEAEPPEPEAPPPPAAAPEPVAEPQPVAEPAADQAPKPAPALGPAPETTPAPDRDAMMAEAAQLVRDLLWGSRDARGLPQDLPAFAPAEIGFVLAAIAARQPLDLAESAALPGEIAAAGAAEGLHVSPREVTAVLRWLVRGYAKLAEPPAPDAAPRLGRVLYATLVAAVRAVDEQLSEQEKDALRGWAQSGLNGE